MAKHGFDLSDKVGTLLVSNQGFNDLPTIKSVYSVLFPSSGELTSCLNHPDLWLLYQRRHLFVHRRGVVDQAYIDNTSDTAPLGSTLEITPKKFEEHFKGVVETGEALLHCLPKKIHNLTRRRVRSWLIADVLRFFDLRPLYPQKRTSGHTRIM